MASIQRQYKINTSKHKNFEVIEEEYSNVYEVEEDCRTRKITDNNFEDVKNNWNSHFNGCKSYDETLNLLKNGYVDKVEQISREITKTAKGQNKRIQFRNDIVGYAPIVPLAMLNIPNSMLNSEIKPIKTKVLDLYYDMTCSCGTDSDNIIRVGIEFLKVITAMEMQGYRINLTAIQTYTNGNLTNILKIKLKSANQPLDLKRISFPTIHTAFFRVIGFDWYSKTPKGKHIWGYGHSLIYEFAKKKFIKEDYKELMEFKNQVLGQNSVYISVTSLIDEKTEDIPKIIKEMIEYECKCNNS